MKVLLKQEVRKVGKRGDVVDVSDGYGANYLIPSGLAVLFTESAKKEYEHELALEKEKDLADKKAAEELASRLSTLVLEFEAPAGRRGEMIGTVSNKEMIKALEKNYGIKLKKEQFTDKNLLVNGFGKTEVPVLLYKGLSGEVKGNLVVDVKLKEKK